VNNRQRLTARDYKGARRGQLDWQRWREIGIGLAAGLLVALVVYVSDHRAGEPPPVRGPDAPRTLDPASKPGTAGAAARAARAARGAPLGDELPGTGAAAEDSYTFYDKLPKFEVVVPEKERGARVDAAAKVERPGTYFLQAGSYRKAEDAERVRAQLARQNISANVQRVALDTDVWFRIRIGPIKDLAQLNRLRQQLQSADIDSLVIRVEE
jgi:cell division septation protein DedD